MGRWVWLMLMGCASVQHLNPEVLAPPPREVAPETAQVRLAQAVRAEVLGDVDRAEQELLWVQQLDPHNPAAWQAVAPIWLGIGRPEQARQAMERAVALGVDRATLAELWHAADGCVAENLSKHATGWGGECDAVGQGVSHTRPVPMGEGVLEDE